ncbi:MAG: hypothetical protein RL071_1769 [Pseudomonadota bacterium]
MAEARAAALLLLAACSKAPPAAPGALPATLPEAAALMAGDWGWRGGAEHWVQVDGALVGAGFAVRGGKVSGYELLAVQAVPGGLRYEALPGCARWAHFDQRPGAPLLFGRDPGDFPATLRYTRAGDALRAEVRGEAGDGFVMQLRPRPAPSGLPTALALAWSPTVRRWEAGAELPADAPPWPLPGAAGVWRAAPGGVLSLVADVENGAPRALMVEADGQGGGRIICAARLPPPG